MLEGVQVTLREHFRFVHQATHLINTTSVVGGFAPFDFVSLTHHSLKLQLFESREPHSSKGSDRRDLVPANQRRCRAIPSCIRDMKLNDLELLHHCP